MPKLHPYEARLQSEHIANRHEGEKPMKVIAKKPLFCLPRALHKPLTRLKLFMKGEKRIFEHSVHNAVSGHTAASLTRQSKNSSGSLLL